MKVRLLCPLLAGMLAGGGAAAWAHGLERHYGTPINGQGAPSRASSGGSPGFTLLALDVNSAAMARALEEGNLDDVRKRARRLPQMVAELNRRSQSLEPDERVRAAKAFAAISECAARVHATALEDDAASLRAELVSLRELAASLQSSLRESAAP